MILFSMVMKAKRQTPIMLHFSGFILKLEAIPKNLKYRVLERAALDFDLQVTGSSGFGCIHTCEDRGCYQIHGLSLLLNLEISM